MQRSYINAIYSLLKKDKNVISCLSDSGTDYDDMLKREFPDQIINFGISENNKVAASAGMSFEGKIPFVYTTSAFLAYRSYEFIRDDICAQGANVKLVGMGTGLSWSTLGITHHTTEDISVLKVLPGLTILSPASPKELTKCIEEAYNNYGPFYIRMGMGNEMEIYENKVPFVIGKNNIIRDGKDITIFSTGSIIEEVIKAVDLLKKNNISAKVINIHSIKPFDEESIKKENNKIIFSVEEHNVIGGIGSSIADVIVKHGLNIKLVKIGLNDVFAKGYGTRKEVLKMNNLDFESIYKRIKESL